MASASGDEEIDRGTAGGPLSRRPNRSILPVLLLTALLSSGVSPGTCPAHAQSGFRASSSFDPPKGCVAARSLAKQFGAVQACRQSFSRTHEFVLILLEMRVRSKSKTRGAAGAEMTRAVRRHVAQLRKANSSIPGQKIGMFETSTPAPGVSLPGGADHCSQINAVMFDRRVPGFSGDEFRLWTLSEVCARFDPSSQTIQLVELRATERFRVSTDGPLAKRRFDQLIPTTTALRAIQTLQID